MFIVTRLLSRIDVKYRFLKENRYSLLRSFCTFDFKWSKKQWIHVFLSQFYVAKVVLDIFFVRVKLGIMPSLHTYVCVLHPESL